MVDFRITKQIEASQDSIWNIISDVDREPEFWHGTKSIKNIRKNGNVIEREAVIAFRNSICKEVITLNPKNSVEKNITDGAIIGTKNIVLTPIETNKTRVDVQWNIRVKGIFGLFRGLIKKHISEG
ncbi:MAG: SRPBCC family protein, partial [Nitrososphaeraceae archaeon]|nr:SRPBCC family protein [Nitrososphaeraceae archaeon]MDW0333952.1 SRPBCC family protein [Nitrososphaeraceae archaeon]